MEIRCGNCEKLFRVSDDKITGTGIKFPCTRCGAEVRITREDFEHYTMSQSAVSVLDLFEPKLIAAPPSPTPTAPGPAAEETALPEQESKASLLVPPERIPELVKPTDPVTPQTAQVRPAVPKKETTQPAVAPPVSRATERAAKGPVAPATTARSGRMLLVVFGVLIVAGLAAYGIFDYFQTTPQEKAEQPAPTMVTMEGLYIINPTGAMDAKGDLLVTGVIENATDKEKAAWHVVLEVYDAEGSVLSKIRLLNGNQIYTRRDYDILAARGADVQGLKAKLLQRAGIVIPPKGRAAFEMRYVQPKPGIASFVAQVVPFEREQLNREIAEEMK